MAAPYFTPAERAECFGPWAERDSAAAIGTPAARALVAVRRELSAREAEERELRRARMQAFRL